MTVRELVRQLLTIEDLDITITSMHVTGDDVEFTFYEPEYDCDWDYNEDMGYDPYMGCYTDDC